MQDRIKSPFYASRRLTLRPLIQADAPAFWRCWSHPAVAPWLGMQPPSSPEETERLLGELLQLEREQASLRWAVTLPGGEVIGSCGYNYWQLEGAYRGEIGCELHPDHWGRGLMKEALEPVIRHGFDKMGLNRLEAQCDPDNVRAGALFMSLGFKKEGVLNEFRHDGGHFRDVALYALLHREWKLRLS